ncbi:hypothetical protein ABZ215_21390 [Amycolatopsis sp. NPDC006131]|uniref:hypothetical protein n=1 Tax=Amycolatopsis sp. NPDC006131 TaxID=3156731 RepID=UPI0033BEDCD4
MRVLLGVALLAMTLLTACEDHDPGPKEQTAPAPARVDEPTALQFAPRVWLAGDERFTPMDATAYIRQSVLRYEHDDCADPEPVADPVDPGKLRGTVYKHHKDADPAVPSPDKPLFPCARHSGDEVSPNSDGGFYLDAHDDVQPDDAPPPMYWEHHRADDERSAYVYWFFYGRNELRPAGTPVGNTHEGDWERVAVQLRNGEPVAVTFFGHGAEPCSVPWADLDHDDGHPVVYSAKGSHASYPSKGWHVSGATFDWTSQGNLWRTQPRALDGEPWYGYRGAWGAQSLVPGFSGPAGPYPGRQLADVFTDRRCAMPARLPDGFAGTWETRDPVEQSPAARPYHMRVVLGGDSNPVEYRTTWTGPDPDLACRGILRLVDATTQWLELRETILDKDAGNCVTEGTVTLHRDGESLKMTYSGGSVTGSATLYRKQDGPPPSTSSAPPTSSGPSASEGIRRYEEFLHAVGREDLAVVCEIAGPAAKKAEDQGFGPCEQTMPITFQMISPAQKRALRTATVDRAGVIETAGRIEIPARAVRADTPFTESDLGDAVLEYRGGQWYVVD